MTIQAYDTDAAALLNALLTTIEKDLIPLTRSTVSSGNNKVSGAAILSKSNLVPITAAANNEGASPLLHGEINCLQQFFGRTPTPTPTPTPPAATNNHRPVSSRRQDPRDCVFLATHEPCSLCLSGIAWSRFDNVFYLFTHEDSRDMFGSPHDIEILQEVFGNPPPAAAPASTESETLEESTDDARPLYNRRNKFFTARSVGDLVREIVEKHGATEGRKWEDEVTRVKALYNGLRDTSLRKPGYAHSGSFWK
ncbi:cytidine deoxycytidylate deaminase family protein [Xylaria sp. CBS 124048]|nr:cytidine deoxycytidylate deaminase family protein [Xylaria sp. CBS 124048]